MWWVNWNKSIMYRTICIILCFIKGNLHFMSLSALSANIDQPWQLFFTLSDEHIEEIKRVKDSVNIPTSLDIHKGKVVSVEAPPLIALYNCQGINHYYSEPGLGKIEKKYHQPLYLQKKKWIPTDVEKKKKVPYISREKSQRGTFHPRTPHSRSIIVCRLVY